MDKTIFEDKEEGEEKRSVIVENRKRQRAEKKGTDVREEGDCGKTVIGGKRARARA